MAAPQVRNLADILAEYQAAGKPQIEAIDTDINNNEQSGLAQVQGLDATKTKAFGGIEQAAQNKGMLFSGFAPDAQANYLGTTYLPELAKLQGGIASVRNTLTGKKADLATQWNTQAIDTRNKEQSAYEQYQQQEQQRAWEAEQNRIKMEFEAKQQAANRAAQARASSAASAASKPTRDEYTSAHQMLDGQLKRVKDSGYAGELFNKIPTRGETMAQFNTTFRGVISPQEITAMVNKLYGRYYIDK